jgi:hypothetical protein
MEHGYPDKDLATPSCGALNRLALPVAAIAALGLSLVGTGIAAPGVSAQVPAGVSVTVSTANTLATVPGTAIGLNTSTYDRNMTDPMVPQLLRHAGVALLRYPGGTESDEYNWATNTDTISGQEQATDFDQFMQVARASGAQAMITVNYGTGTPAEAAAWVKYANVQHHYNVRYWEIGNEVYGNGTYGADWEPDAECQVSSASGASPFNPDGGTLSPEKPGAGQAPTFNCGPLQYAENVAQFAEAMKSVDPGIVIGVVLTAPDNWPDDNDISYICGGSTSSPTISDCYWDTTVLSELAQLHVRIGFADVHWYPQNPSNVTGYTSPPAATGTTAGAAPDDANLLASDSQIPGMVSTLEQRATGDYGHSLPIMVTETNSVSSNPGRQTVSVVNGLFLDQDYLTWLDNGVQNVDWWQLHNGIVTSGDNTATDYAAQSSHGDPPASLYGDTLYGDYGALSDGSCGDTPSYATPSEQLVCEPQGDTPFPAYYGLEMLSRFIQPGDRLVSASSSNSLVQSFAAEGPGNQLRVMVVNDDPTNSYSVSASVNGSPVTPGNTALSYGADMGAPASTYSASGSFVIPPYTVSIFTLGGQGAH